MDQRRDLHHPDTTRLVEALQDGQKMATCAGLTQVSLLAGEVVFREGDDSRSMYVLVSGELVVKSGPGMGSRLLATIFPGEVVGEVAFLTGERRSATVSASTPAVLWEITDEALVLGARAGEGWAVELIFATARRLACNLVVVRDEVKALIADSSDGSGRPTKEPELEKLRRCLSAEWTF